MSLVPTNSLSLGLMWLLLTDSLTSTALTQDIFNMIDKAWL